MAGRFPEKPIMKSLIEILRELTHGKSELEARMYEVESVLAEHVLLMKMLPKSTAREHWAKEIRGFIKPLVKKQRHNGKFPTERVYFANLFEKSLGTFDEYLHQVAVCKDDVEESYAKEVSIDIADEQTYVQVRSFYKKLCNLLSQGTIPKFVDILNMLN